MDVGLELGVTPVPASLQSEALQPWGGLAPRAGGQRGSSPMERGSCSGEAGGRWGAGLWLWGVPFPKGLASTCCR